MNKNNPFQIGIGGLVSSGKTALIESICKNLRDTYEIAVVTNDIYTREDAEFLTKKKALPFVFTNLKTGQGLDEIIRFIKREGLLEE